MTVTEKHDRSKLSEGRTTNMGFAFLKKLEEDKFETAHATSPCKDYLNDAVYGEHLNISVSACGLNYTPQKIFDKKFSYMTIKMFPPNRYMSMSNSNASTEAALKTDKKRLKDNYKNMQKLLNYIEAKLNLPLTEITEANDDFYVVKFAYYWSSQTYLISLYSLLLRMGQFYDGKGTPVEFLNSYNNPLDQSLWNQAKLKLLLLLYGYKTEQTFDPKTGGGIHGAGICQYPVNNIKF